MKKLYANLDFWGFTTSLLCAIHCALLPVLLSFGLLGSSFSWLNHPLLELIVVILTIFFVYQSLLKGYGSGHVHRSTFIIALIGLSLIVIHHFLGQFATVTVVCGGLMIAFSHFQNLYLHKYLNQNHKHSH